jgi:hypothetical protein
MENNRSSVRLIFGAFILGALFSLLLAVLATWSNLEAAFYGFDRRASTPLPGLHCPILLNRNETGRVWVKVSNTTKQKLSPSIRAEFSSPLEPISALNFANLDPGQSQTMQWTIGPDNIDLQKFIFSKVLVYSTYPIPDRENTCGTFIVDLPISGNILVGALLLLGLAGMGGSLWWLWRTQTGNIDTMRALRPFTFLGVVIVVALSASLLGFWLQALLLLAVVLIMIIVTMNFLVFR